jgi:hypothetical protein
MSRMRTGAVPSQIHPSTPSGLASLPIVWRDLCVHFSIGDIANLITSVATAAGVILIYLQLREAAHTRKSEATASLIEGLASEDQRQLRRFVYQTELSDPSKLSDEDRWKVERAAVQLSRTALLCSKGLADERTILDTFGEAFVRVWDKLQPFVAFERSHRGPTYLRAFEDMSQRAQKHWSYR